MEIYRYTDLVDIGSYGLTFERRPINRMTGRVFKALKLYATRRRFPVERILATMLLDTKPTYDANLFVLPHNLWLMRNDTGGWTVMHSCVEWAHCRPARWR